MAITQQFVDTVGAALLLACPLTSADPDSITAVKEKILKFDRELGRAPNEAQVISWAVPFEQALLQKKEAAEAQARQKQEEAEAKVRQRQARADARKQQREFDQLPSSVTRAQANEDLRRMREQSAPERFVPEREYSNAEIDLMSDSEYKRLLFGIETEELNQSKPDLQAEEYYKNRILKSRNKGGSPADKLMRSALRREIREGLR